MTQGMGDPLSGLIRQAAGTSGGFALKRGELVAVTMAGRLEVLDPDSRAILECDCLNSVRLPDPSTSKAPQVVYADLTGGNGRPVVLGVIGQPVTEAKDPLAATETDTDRIVLRAGQEITLVCGGGSIRITKDGKVVIRGLDILTRANRTNRIKGGSVQIN
jgi:hypothetical protein